MPDASAKFRSDLVATAVEADGVSYVDVSDPRTGKSFRFYDFEYALATQLNGQELDAIVTWGASSYGLELTPSGIHEFADRLAELGFLEAPDDGSAIELVADDSQDTEPPPPIASGGWESSNTKPGVGGVPWQRAAIAREIVAEPAGTETLMGFSARVPIPEPVAPPRHADLLVDGQTIMGFAAVIDELNSEMQHAEPPPRPLAPQQQPPPRAFERRQPPGPDTVQMSPFDDEVVRTRRTLLAARPDRAPQGKAAGLSLTAVMWIVVLIAAAAAVGYYLWSRQQVPSEARRVRVVAPRPAAVYRWFDPVGAVVGGETRALSFQTAGTVAEVLPAKTRVATGEIIAKLQGITAHEAEVNRHRSRLGYYQQLRDSMMAAGNRSEQSSAELKLAQKKNLLAEAEVLLDRLIVRATEPGEIVEVVARAGTSVAAGAPVVEVKAAMLLAEFALPARDAEAAAHLGFCRVEVVGGAPTASNAAPGAAAAGAGALGPGATRFADCKIAGAAATGGKQQVELSSGADLAVGQPLRLARSRYDGVFPVPRAAIVHVGDTDRVFVAGTGGIAEARAVSLADAGPDEALVSQGIDVGDRVIADPPADLRDGEAIQIQK